MELVFMSTHFVLPFLLLVGASVLLMNRMLVTLLMVLLLSFLVGYESLMHAWLWRNLLIFRLDLLLRVFLLGLHRILLLLLRQVEDLLLIWSFWSLQLKLAMLREVIVHLRNIMVVQLLLILVVTFFSRPQTFIVSMSIEHILVIFPCLRGGD